MHPPLSPDRSEVSDDARFRAGELEVEQHSAELRKELSLPNLVFTQVLSILGLAWIGTAGKLGGSHLMFWLGAIALFYLPSAFVIIHLNNEMPLEGGLYQWAKLRFNESTGFLVALNLWLYNIMFISQMGLLLANNLAYALGPSAGRIANSRLVIAVASLLTTIGLVLVARVARTDQMLAPILDPLHRTPEPARQERDQQVFRIDMPLDAEAAADVECDTADARLGHAQD